ncbi:MAG: hypothetical protein ACE1Z9_03820 [Acidimicrobiia bacterium]
MADSNWERFAPLTGVVFVVLLVAGVVVINNYDYLPPAAEIESFYEDSSTAISVGAFLALLSVFFFLWFLGSVRSTLRVTEGGTGRLSAVAFGGGVAAAAAMIVGYSATLAAAQRAGTTGGIGADAATSLHDLASVLVGNTAPIAFAVLVAATALVALRTGVFPAWLAWVSVVLAVGLLTPLNYIFMGFALLWVLIVSILLFRQNRLNGGSGG